VAARRAALDSLFVGDQHVSATPYYQNTPMLGRLLAEWGEAPAGCLFLLPLWHPVLVAEQIGTLAAIAQGPFIMQCGLGWGEARFAAMGANIRTRPSAFEEALDIVRRLLAGETVSSSRRFRIAHRGRFAEEEEAEGAGEGSLQDSLAKPLDDLPLPARAINALKNAEILVVADLVQKTDADLEQVKNLGDKSIDEIKAALAALGLSLGMRIDPNLLGTLGRGGTK